MKNAVEAVMNGWGVSFDITSSIDSGCHGDLLLLLLFLTVAYIVCN